jgi:tRNA G18 (ribose-2'-O)-methylase SpoU
VGSIFRTADACGISHIYLCGYTPDPIDKFGRDRSDISKVSLGAEKSIAWTHVDDTLELVEKLKQDNFEIIAIEQSEHSVDYKKVEIKEKVAFILGEEVHGVPQEILNACDIVAEIPMHGGKESLNVSVSAGIALFRMLGV